MKPRTAASSRVPVGTPWLAALAPGREDIPVIQQCLTAHRGEPNGWIEDGLASVGDVKVIRGIWYCAVFPVEGTRETCRAQLLDMGYSTEGGLTTPLPARVSKP